MLAAEVTRASQRLVRFHSPSGCELAAFDGFSKSVLFQHNLRLDVRPSSHLILIMCSTQLSIVHCSVFMNVVVDGIKIVAGSAKPIFSDEEFIEHLLIQLSHRLLRGTFVSLCLYNRSLTNSYCV